MDNLTIPHMIMLVVTVGLLLNVLISMIRDRRHYKKVLEELNAKRKNDLGAPRTLTENDNPR
jgi:hypothetical protein